MSEIEKHTTSSEKHWHLWYLLFPVLYICIGILLIHIMTASGKWPYGDDVMYHIYRGEKVLKAIRHGNLWVHLDTDWYNGVEILRYWSPLPAYFMALCQWIAGGAMGGYLLFTGIVYVLSALSWHVIGIRMGRPVLGSILGILWFFLPQNVVTYFVSGNLAGMCAVACVLPWLIASLWEYLEQPSGRHIWKLALLTALMALCHSGFTLLALLVLVLWILFQKLYDHSLKYGISAILVMVFGFLLTGFWFLASRKGVSSVDYTQQLRDSFQSFWVTLNPADRVLHNFSHYYFGLSIFLIAVFGCFVATKKARAGFLTTVVICLMTTKTAYQVIRVLPGGSILWTNRMIGIAGALFFFSLLEWKTLKKKFQILFVLLLALDFLPSGLVIYGNGNHASVTERWKEEQDGTLLTEAKSLSKQRIALIDGSTLGSTGAYLTSTWRGENDAAYGAGYEAAVTRKNITMLNRSANDGYYYYFFDRAEELGCDVIDLQISQLANGSSDIQSASAAAEKRGYTLADQNGEYLLYQLKVDGTVDGTFGTMNSYPGIAIGKNASEVAETFPALKEADEINLSHYTYQELKDYDLIFLDGFTMGDRQKAEELIEKLADHGVQVIIMADGMPEDKASRNQKFLGVTCSPISFRNGYPTLHTNVGTLDLMLFPKGSRHWNTVYLNGLKDVTGTIEDNGLTLAFAGHPKNQNITFIGLNLTYFYGLTKDPKAGKFLSQTIHMSSSDIPKRQIVPLKIHETSDGLQIEAGADQVNTTLAYHDIFTSKSLIASAHNLLYVNQGTTVIHYRNPYLFGGIAMTAVACAILVWMSVIQKKRKRL